MKKLTLFMLAACAWFTTATSAVADETTEPTTEPTVDAEPTAASSLTSGYYVIKSHVKSTEGYVYHSTSDTERPFRQKTVANMGTILSTLSSNTNFVWYVNVASDGTFTLQNLASGDYIPAQENYGQEWNDMKAAKTAHTFANAALLKPQSYASSDSYTPLTNGMLLACSNYSALLQIHCNTSGEHNLSFWGSAETDVEDGKGSITEFALYKVTGNFSSVESSIEKGTILAVTETEGTTVRKWAGVSGTEYTLHTTASSIALKELGFAYSTVQPTFSYEPTNMTLSESNCAFTITKTGGSYNPNTEVFGKYYRIHSKATDRWNYMSTENIFVGTDGLLSTAYNGNESLDRKVRVTAESAAYLPQIWQLVDAGNGQVKFKNMNNSRYLANSSDFDMPIDDANAGSFYILKGTGTYADFNAETDFEINTGSATINCGNASRNHDLTTWNGHYDALDNFWAFEEVTTVPVTISEANYATVGYPFAVSVPSESGITAYTVSKAEGGYLTLSEIADGIIPANTGVILYHDGATTANLTITTSDKTIEGNLLTATTAKRTGYTSGDTYVLALNSAGNAAFLKSELTTVPANKAYVATSNIPAETAASVLNFNFGGDVTGINAVNTANTKANTYYDLNGRRVLYPAHGIFVNGNGQKVLVK